MMIDDLLFNVAERCESLKIGDDEDSVSRVYSEVEKAMLADSLSCDVIVPLLLTSFAEEHIEVGNNVSIEKMSEGLQLARAPHWDYSSVPGPLRSAATHAVLVRGLEIQNLHPLHHVLCQYDMTKALEVVDQVLRSLRVLSGTPTGYADVYVQPQGWAYSWVGDLPPLAHVETLRKFPAEMEDGRWNSEPRPYSKDVTDAVPLMYSSLTSGNRRVAIAARRLDLSRLRGEPEDQVLDACIGLEALLGNELTEITHRLAQRAAALLRKRFPPGQTYKLVKDIYACRSKIAHGADAAKKMRIVFNDVAVLASTASVFILSEVIREVALGVEGSSPEDLDSLLLHSIAKEAERSDPDI